MTVTVQQNAGAGVLEISNRASVQKLGGETVSAITARMDNHESGLNPNAHAIGSIGGLQAVLDGKAAVSHTHSIGNVTGLQTALDGKEPAFSKNTAFNKNYGTTAGTTCQGNDSRLSDARTPTAHTHVITDVTGLQSALDGKANSFSGYTGSITVVKTVNFTSQTVTTATINISNGIITSII